MCRRALPPDHYRFHALRAPDSGVAEALVRLERSSIIQPRWIIGLMVGLFTGFLAINMFVALALASP